MARNMCEIADFFELQRSSRMMCAESVPTARVPSTPRLQKSLNKTEGQNATTAKNAEPPAVQPLSVTPCAPCTPRSPTSHHTALAMESTTQSSAQTPTYDTARTS